MGSMVEKKQRANINKMLLVSANRSPYIHVLNSRRRSSQVGNTGANR